MLLKKKCNILMIYIFAIVNIIFSQTNIKVIKEFKINPFSFCFMDNNKALIQDEKKTRIYDISKEKFIYEKDTNKNIFYMANSLGDLIIYYSQKAVEERECQIFDYKANNTKDLSNNFDKNKDRDFYFDYYGDAKSFIYQYTNESYENVKDLNFIYKIMKFNLISNKKEMLFNNARLVDYNNGLLLYQDMTIKDKEVYNLYDQNKMENIDTFINNFNLKYLKIYKNNSYLGINVDKNGVKLFLLQNKKTNEIKIKDSYNCLADYKYNFKNDMILLSCYNKLSNFNNQYFLLLFKIE